MAILNAGDVVGPYRVAALLGEGGMGEVYRAVRQGPLGFERAVALKVLGKGAAAGKPWVGMFKNEALLGARLHHANVVPVVDCGVRRDGLMWIAQELVVGLDLARVCRHRAMGVAEALHVTHEILRGLRYLHEGTPCVVHQDVKPANILVGTDGSVRIADFGIAEMSVAGDEARTPRYTKGSPAYMAPECALDLAPPTPRSDLFGVGLVLCEMLAGRALCASPPARRAVLGGRLGRLADVGVSAPADVEELVRWLLAADPEQRCPSAKHALAFLARMPEARAAGPRELETLVAAAAAAADGEEQRPTAHARLVSTRTWLPC